MSQKMARINDPLPLPATFSLTMAWVAGRGNGPVLIPSRMKTLARKLLINQPCKFLDPRRDTLAFD